MRQYTAVSPSCLVCGTGLRQTKQTNIKSWDLSFFFFFWRHNFLSFLVLIGFTKENLENILKKKQTKNFPWDFPGSPVVEILCFHCRGYRFDPWSKNVRKMPLSLFPGGQSFLMTMLPYSHYVFTATGVYRHIYLTHMGKSFIVKAEWSYTAEDLGACPPPYPTPQLPARTLH